MRTTYGEALARDLSKDGVSPTRAAMMVAAFVAPVLLLCSAAIHDPRLAASHDALRLLAFAIAVPTYGALGVPYVRHLQGRAQVLDKFVVALSAIALTVSSATAILGRGEVFFEVGAVALLVATAGRLLETRVRLHTAIAPMLAVFAATWASFVLRGVAWSPAVLLLIVLPAPLLVAGQLTSAARRA